MKISNVEDSLEEFDSRYMESYNQVVNKCHCCLNGPAKSHRARSVPTKAPGLKLSSPFLEHKNMGTFPMECQTGAQLDGESFFADSIAKAPRASHRRGSHGRETLVPSVTISSIDTIVGMHKSKHPATATSSPGCYRNKPQRRNTLPLSNCCVGNPFYKPPATKEIRSLNSIPTMTTFDFQSQHANLATSPTFPEESGTKKRKVSGKPDLQTSPRMSNNIPNTSFSETSSSSFDSVLTLEPNQFEQFDLFDKADHFEFDQLDPTDQFDPLNFDYFISKESDFFNDYKLDFNENSNI